MTSDSTLIVAKPKPPASFISLSHELRQTILLFLRDDTLLSKLDAGNLGRVYQEHVEHICERVDALQKVSHEIIDDVKYVEGKWMEESVEKYKQWLVKMDEKWAVEGVD
jgi:hypothetical protein